MAAAVTIVFWGVVLLAALGNHMYVAIAAFAIWMALTAVAVIWRV